MRSGGVSMHEASPLCNTFRGVVPASWRLHRWYLKNCPEILLPEAREGFGGETLRIVWHVFHSRRRCFSSGGAGSYWRVQFAVPGITELPRGRGRDLQTEVTGIGRATGGSKEGAGSRKPTADLVDAVNIECPFGTTRVLQGVTALSLLTEPGLAARQSPCYR